MKHFKLFFALFAMLALGVGNAWGAEELKETITPKDNGSDSNTAFTTATALSNGFVSNAAINAVTEVSKVYPGNGGWKFGSSSAAGNISFTLKTPISNVTKIVITAKQYHATKKTTLNCNNIGAKTLTTSFADYEYEYTTPTKVSTISLVSAKASSGDFRCYVKEIKIYAETTSGGSIETALSATPTEIDFGTVYEGATVADKTVAVNFANLTGNVTYSGLSTPFTATGTISNDGDKITIAANTTTIGDYTQTLTIASTADSKTAEVTVKMNVVEKPAPTGTFTLHTGALVEGDYVIVDGTNAMNNTVTSNRLQYNAVTISNNEIVDPLATTIWHIAPNGEYWTIYSAHAEKYAASTTAKNQATLAASVSDNTKWTVTMSGNTFDFENLARSNGSDSGNKYLRKNGSYGFACYASGTGAKLSLYRKAGAKYNVTVNSTTNGTVTADPTSAEAGTTITLTVTPAGGYVLDALTVTDASSNPVTVTDNKFTMPASDVTVTATFKENEKPAATLTLSKNGVEETFPGSWKQDDVVTLPSITSDCVKEFVGWSADANCATEPEYKAGDEYTLASTTQTLYAVYATVGGGGEATAVNTLSSNGWANESKHTSLEIDENVKATITGGGNSGKYYTSGTNWRLYQNESAKITISTVYGELKSVKFTFTSSNTGTLLYNSTALTSGTAVEVTGTSATFSVGNSGSATNGQIRITKIEVVYTGGVSYSDYSTTCVAAPKAEVTPTEVTATAAGVNGTLEVSYENVNTANVSVALYNDEACTEAFTADWLTASLDGDKNIAYTVAENTTYAERKAYIQLTAPEENGTTDPAVVVIPVTQAGKDKVFASLAELVAADLTKGDEVTVTLNNDVIKDFYIYSSKRCGVVFDVQKDGKDIKIYFNNQTTIDDWAVGGKLSGTLTNVEWTTYSSAWQLVPDYNTWAWANLTYTEPKAVSTVVVGGAPTKTTYVDGEAFDPAGLTVTVNYNDATSEVNPTGVTFTVTPATLVKGQTSVSVTATYNTVSSAPYEVTGLTVNDIPTKTVAEFIAAGGTRCYLEGIVSGLTEGNSMKYGNFDLTDASGTIYVYGCLNGAGESQKFAELGVKNGDKIKVIADDYELYGGTKDEAKNVQYVSHISAATITIADITMEVEEVKTISATVDQADAVVTYTIKENAANAISLSGNTITALAEGTATITATVAEGATYLGNSVDFTVTVGPKTESDEVVILAELDGKWYAMKGAVPSGKSNQLDAIEVTYFNGILYNVAESDKASITWTRSVVDGKATFANNGKYLKGDTDTDLTLSASVDDKCKWMWDDENGYYTTNTSGTIRTFLYRNGYNFKNYGVSQAGKEDANGNYSELPVVTAPVYETGDITYTRNVTNKYGTICLPYASASTSGATFFEVVGQETGKVYLASVTELEAGVPYIFEKTANTITVTCQGEAVAEAGSANGLVGTFTEITVPDGAYILYNNAFCTNEPAGTLNKIRANRAYLNLADINGGAPTQMPGRRYIGMSVQGENEATGFENIVAPEGQAVKAIVNGQLIIIRDGVKYNVQGQKL